MSYYTDDNGNGVMEETIPGRGDMDLAHISAAEYKELIAQYGYADIDEQNKSKPAPGVAKGVMVKYFNYYANTADGKILVAYYDSVANGGNGNGVIDTGDSLDRNGDGVTNWLDNSWRELHYYYWFDNGEGGLRAVRDDQLAVEGLSRDDDPPEEVLYR